MSQNTGGVTSLGAADFFDNMDSGSLLNLEKTGPREFAFEVQSRELHGPQGSLMTWFHGACELGRCQVREGDSLRMTVRAPNRLQHIRPVFSHDAEHWSYVPDWAYEDHELEFSVPVEPGAGRVYFATHYPYPSTRVFEQVIKHTENSCVRSVDVIGRTERGRPILMLSITDPNVDDAGKRTVLLSAGSHAGETASLWGMEGIIEFLLSGKPEAGEMLRRAVFYLVPMLNVDGAALGLDRRQATGVNIYFDYRKFESVEARVMWELVKRLRPGLWLDLHSWHLGVSEGAFGPVEEIVGAEKWALVKPLAESVGRHFAIKDWGADTLDCPNTQALLQFGIPGFGPEFNMGRGADGNWKSIEDQKALGSAIVRGVRESIG